jgi:hypothetical protein
MMKIEIGGLKSFIISFASKAESKIQGQGDTAEVVHRALVVINNKHP